jgi:8-oxo-dGTP pyrophosphatase MutT (NUDIX family)
MMEKILFRGNWLTVVERDGYEFIQDKNNKAVAVLPFQAGTPEEPILFLAREETLPPHNPPRHLCSLTGFIDGEENPREAAVRELAEESGYYAQPSELIGLGEVFPSKASAMKLHLFAIDVSDKMQSEAMGDGTAGEADATTVWLTRKRAGVVPDAVFGAMLNRLSLWLQEEFF